jgi:hypothetical protein
MNHATSPRLKHWVTLTTPHGFTGGLVECFIGHFNVSQVDTFIEMPYLHLNLKAVSRMTDNNNPPAVDSALSSLIDLKVRQMASFSVSANRG